MVGITTTILFCVISFVISGIIFGLISFFVGIAYRKKIAESELGSAEEEAKNIVNTAVKSAESKRKELLIEAKEEIHKLRLDFDKDIKELRSDVSRQERRLQQKEESIDKKIDVLEKKEELINKKNSTITNNLAEIETLKQNHVKELERISEFTTEQAKEIILNKLESELVHEKASMISMYENQINDNAEQKAKDIISLAISRCAADHVSEMTISVVALPNDEMKGRIIGREGRNIRALETITGVALIVDDTPEAITLSCFDPVRREVARLSLEKLIADGRIHPTRIEDMVQKATKEVDQKIKEDGERAVIETGVIGIHPDLIKLIGRLKYRTSYGQNVLKHSIEVSLLSGIMANELGIDPMLAKRAGLLHDIGKGLTHEIEGSHVEIGVSYCKKYKENQDVIHAVEAHHGDVEPKTALACIVKAADAISAARPAARQENLEGYVKRLEKLEEIASSFEGVEKCFAIQAGREIRIMIDPNIIEDDMITIIARNIVKRIEQELEYPGQIKVNVIRENRAIEFAK